MYITDEKRYERMKYLGKYPEIYRVAKRQLIFMCMYHYQKGMCYLSGKELEDGFKGVPHFEIEKKLKLIDFLVEYNICSSKREAREFINAGSISINGNKMSDENIVTLKYH